VVGNEPAVVIEFDYEGETARRLGLPETHRHAWEPPRNPPRRRTDPTSRRARRDGRGPRRSRP
jgi:hypothetical protein